MAQQAKKGDWVRIFSVVLPPEERTAPLPEDTAARPLTLVVRGFLENETAAVGEEATVKTLIGRRLTGTLDRITPGHEHNFGRTSPELLEVGRRLRAIMRQKEGE